LTKLSLTQNPCATFKEGNTIKHCLFPAAYVAFKLHHNHCNELAEELKKTRQKPPNSKDSVKVITSEITKTKT